MFIDFTVENYRSIKEPVTLSAVAQTHGANEQDNKITEPFSYPARKLEILPVLGIFGANASGKSNVINALGEFLNYSFFSTQQDINAYSTPSFATPFKLGTTGKKKPTNFIFRALVKGNIYIFELSLNQVQILREKLSYIPESSKRNVSRKLFERIWDHESTSYVVNNGPDFGESYREIQLALKKSQTFLGFFVFGLQNEVLQPLISWLAGYWGAARTLKSDQMDYLLSCMSLKNDRFPHLFVKVRNVLRKFDTGIDEIEIKEIQGLESGDLQYEVWVYHKTKKGREKWQLSEESLGTQKLFTLATKLFIVFEMGGFMLVDELGFGTHPKINQEIVHLFQDKKINKKGAQLIFTSHDTTLLSKGLLRRDQIWFTQKREDGSTELYPLSDFVGIRSDLVMDKAYLDGRFGAVPFLPDKEELTELLGV
jgi:AAA15 family ATPase/GTPase